MAETIKVVCRFRPLNDREMKEGPTICVQVPSESSVFIPVNGERVPERTFNLDRVFDWNTHQKQVYDFAAKPIVEAVLKGFNGTVFAYGQTGSGKSYTMEGDHTNADKQGVIPRMVTTVFEAIDAADEHIEFTVKVSIVEIYMEKIRDLLDPKKENLKVHEDKARGIYVGDVTEEYVTCEQDVFELMRCGHENRSVAATNMNAHSSRSHLVFMMTMTQKNLHDLSVKVGKLYLVDLAGSEKVDKTGATGTTLDEAKMINKSLSTLGNVINALTDPKYTHVPYRDSKLTRILQESLGGNSKTTLIITCSPSAFNEAETLSTLRFGQRAKNVKNAAKINQERSVEELKRLLERADRTIAEQRARIALLEGLVKKLGGEVPAATAIADASTTDGTDSQPSESPTRSEGGQASGGAGVDRSEYEDLLEELEEKRAELKAQSETISDLRRQVAQHSERATHLESENQILVNKIADLTVAHESMKYEFSEMSDTLEGERASRKALESELQVVREGQQNLFKQLQERDKQEELSRAAGNSPSGPSASSDRHLEAEEAVSAGRSPPSKQLRIINEALAAQEEGVSALPEEGPAPGEGAPGAPDLATLLQQPREELAKQIRELQRFKLTAVQQMDLLKKQTEAAVAGRAGGSSEWEGEREQLMGDLQKKVERLVDLEVALLEEREKNAELKEMLKDGERPLKRKVSQLDRNLEQLTIMYHKLVSQNSGLKVECQVNEKKLARKEQRIAQLEKNLKEAKQKYEKLLQQCANLTSTVEHLYKNNSISLLGAAVAGGAAGAGATRRANMARPLKGGHRFRSSATRDMTGQLGGVAEETAEAVESTADVPAEAPADSS